MKQFFFVLAIFLSYNTVHGQILNGSFENGLYPDLSNWEWPCIAESDSAAAPGGGDWGVKVPRADSWCFGSAAYQKITTITDGQTFLLTGWAFGQATSQVSIHLGKINNGNITLQAGDSTTSSSWTSLSIESTISLLPGDTAIVLLNPGFGEGPSAGYGYFDLINIEQVLGLNTLEQKNSLKLYPNPCHYQTTLKSEKKLNNATLTMRNILGQTVKQMEKLNGQTVILERGNLSNGIYFIQLAENDKIIAEKKLIITD